MEIKMDIYCGDFQKKKNRYPDSLRKRSGRDTKSLPSFSGSTLPIILPAKAEKADKLNTTPLRAEAMDVAGNIPLRASVLRNSFEAFIEKLLSLLDGIINALTSSRALAIIRVSVSTACFIAVVGVIGGLEKGTLSWGTGIAATLATILIETVCIRKCK